MNLGPVSYAQFSLDSLARFERLKHATGNGPAVVLTSSSSEESSTVRVTTLGSIITIIIVIVIVNTSLVFSGSLANVNSSQSTSLTTTISSVVAVNAWSSSPVYPTKISTQSCVVASGEVYCIGGLTGTNTVTGVTAGVYHARLSSGGVGQWNPSTSYPVGIRETSCVVSGTTVYCIGGYTSSVISSDVYYATISSTGLGQWTKSTSYPFPVWGQSCAAASSVVYCVGGITGPKTNTSQVYYASLSSNGVGQWSSTTTYPVRILQESCVTSGNYIYCIGGLGANSVYFARIFPDGVGVWTATTNYPFPVGPDYPSCVVVGIEVYCVGGYTGPTISNAIHHATLSSSGVGVWGTSANYPVGIWAESCVSSNTNIVCIGGATAAGVIDGVYHS